MLVQSMSGAVHFHRYRYTECAHQQSDGMNHWEYGWPSGVAPASWFQNCFLLGNTPGAKLSWHKWWLSSLAAVVTSISPFPQLFGAHAVQDTIQVCKPSAHPSHQPIYPEPNDDPPCPINDSRRLLHNSRG